MDKATKVAVEKYPIEMYEDVGWRCIDKNEYKRKYFVEGYHQAQKDTIERMIEWLKVHAKDYIVNMTGSYPDAPFDAIIGGECWDELKKAMEKE